MLRVGLNWFLRILLGAATLIALLLVIAFAALRFWYIPHANDYRDWVSNAITKAGGAPVRIERIVGDWSGLRPELKLSGITISDPNGHPALRFDDVRGVLSWWALFSGHVRFRHLDINHPVIAIRRDEAGRVFLGGIELSQSGDQQDLRFEDWLFDQNEVTVRDATISWQDAKLENAVLVVTDLTAHFTEYAGRHRLRIVGKLPPEVAKSAEIEGEVRSRLGPDLFGWIGQISASVKGADVGVLKRYMQLPAVLGDGTGDMKVTVNGKGREGLEADANLSLTNVVAQLKAGGAPLDFERLAGRFKVRSLGPGVELNASNLDIVLAKGAGRLPAGDMAVTYVPVQDGKPGRGRVATSQVELAGLRAVLDTIPLDAVWSQRLANLRMAGIVRDFEFTWQGDGATPGQYSIKGKFDKLALQPAGRFPGFTGVSGELTANHKGGSLKLTGQNSTFDAPPIFWEPLRMDSMQAAARWERRDNQWHVDVEQVEAKNSDGKLNVKAKYHTVANSPGWIDLSAHVSQADGRGVYKYVPKVVGERLRLWLKQAILSGRSDDVAVTLRGDLFHFPFADEKDGLFEVAAKFADGAMEYFHDWPKIESASGNLLFRGKRMEITTTAARVFQSLVKRSRTSIANLANHDQVVEIEGEVEGPLADGLRFIKESPLHQFTHGAIDNFTGTGMVATKLKISLPIHRIAQLKVDGVTTFAGNSVDDGPGAVPALFAMNGSLRFTDKGLFSDKITATILGGPATAKVASAEHFQVRITGQGQVTAVGVAQAYPNPGNKYISGTADWKGYAQFGKGTMELKIDAAPRVLGDVANVQIAKAVGGPMMIVGQGKTSAEALAKQVSPAAQEYLSGAIPWSGKVILDGKTTKTDISAEANVFGGPAKLRLVPLDDGRVSISATGEVAAETLRKRFPHPMTNLLSGSTTWIGTLTVGGSNSSTKISTNLVGMQSDLPSPLNKAAAAALPVELEEIPDGAGRRLLKLRIQGIASAQAFTKERADGKIEIVSGDVTFGGVAKRPDAKGVWVHGALASLDADEWRPLIKLSTGTGSSGGPPPLMLGGVNATFGKMVLFGRTFTDFKIQAIAGEQGWAITLPGEEIRGTATWKTDGSGVLQARLDRLVIPPPNAARIPSVPGGRAVVEDPARITDVESSRYPNMDVVAERFQIGQRRLGKLELMAFQQGQDWRMEKVRISNPHGSFTADGVWQGWLKQPQTSLNVDLKVTNLGDFLGEIGYPNVVKRGTAAIGGSVSWIGEPFAFNPPTMSGEFALSAKSGQFLKAEPGVAKLLGLLNLQSLPKRIVLDFRDVFSSGFAFNEIAGDIRMSRGVVATDNLTMWGSSATVAMKGTADVATETQKLGVKVVPSLGETVAIAGAIAGGPVTGAAAYLIQKILSNPIDKAFAFEYSITGKWEEPVVAKVPRSQTPRKENRR